MSFLKNTFVLCALCFLAGATSTFLLLTGYDKETIKYTETDLSDSQELTEKVIRDFEANENPNNIDRENYHLARTMMTHKVFLGVWKK